MKSRSFDIRDNFLNSFIDRKITTASKDKLDLDQNHSKKNRIQEIRTILNNHR